MKAACNAGFSANPCAPELGRAAPLFSWSSAFPSYCFGLVVLTDLAPALKLESAG
jgi:hypothetical protein